MTSPEVDDTPGLRERKRLATRRAILIAAVQVVRDRGLDAATVDEIARVADVSPRTFFNYFPSKEEALVGDVPSLPDEETQQQFVDDRGPILPAIARLLGKVASAALSDQELILLRRAITKQYPELGVRRFAGMHAFEQQLTDLVARRIAAERPDLDPATVASRARLVAYLAISTMRHAWIEWMNDSGATGDLLQHLELSFEMLPDVVTESLHA
jgi:AcrR family transcriptional regulator